MGPLELQERLRMPYGEVGSLNYTHGLVSETRGRIRKDVWRAKGAPKRGAKKATPNRRRKLARKNPFARARRMYPNGRTWHVSTIENMSVHDVHKHGVRRGDFVKSGSKYGWYCGTTPAGVHWIAWERDKYRPLCARYDAKYGK